MAEDRKTQLQRELKEIQRAEAEAKLAARRCRVCGEQDEDYGGEKGFLTTFDLKISEGEEGHSVIESYLCDEDLPMVVEALAECGITIHAHGGICFLEDRDCPAYEGNAALCRTPEAQYPD